MMPKREFQLDVRDGIATITFAWPEAANAMGADFAHDFHRVLDRVERDREVRVVILTGAGRVFCGGGDLSELMSADSVDPEAELALIRDCNRIAKRLYHFDLPVIAAVNGPAVGGGRGMALACDFAIASQTARYDCFFHRVGLSGADVGVAWLMNRALGPQLAAYYVLTGGSIDAETGLRLGLFTQVVSADELMSAAGAVAQKIVDAPGPAVQLSKLSLRRSLAMDIDTTLELETYVQSYAFRTPSHKKRVAELRARIGKNGSR